MITVTNNKYNEKTEREDLEALVNKSLTTGDYVTIHINSNAYCNNGSRLFETSLALSVAKECIKVGFFAYWCKPSWKYEHWMDIKVRKQPCTETENCKRIY